MSNMINKRRAERISVDLGVTTYIGGEAHTCRACEISATGIRLSHIFDDAPNNQIVEIELPLVQGKLHTQVSARRVWHDDDFDAYEFISPSFAQRTMLERVYGNYTYLTEDGLNSKPTVQIIRKVEAGMTVS
jgi:hypothetical protein